MHYKMIVHELLQDQHPALHERLRKERALLQAMSDYAACLKRHHEFWMDGLSAKRPEADPIQIASQALELAILDLRDDLPSDSSPNGSGSEPLSLDAAMAYVRTPTPPA